MTNQSLQLQNKNPEEGRQKTTETKPAVLQYGFSAMAFLLSVFVGYLWVKIIMDFSHNAHPLVAAAVAFSAMSIVGVLSFAVLRFGVGRYLLREFWGTTIRQIFLELILWTILLTASVYAIDDFWLLRLFENIYDVSNTLYNYWL